MLEFLEMCAKSNKIVSIYDDAEESDKFLTGYINCYNENEILINHITPSGLYDGFILKQISDIFRIDYDDKYQLKIEKLYLLKHQSHYNININDECLLYPILDFALKKHLVIFVSFKKNTVFGFVQSFDNNIINLISIDDYGYNSGKCSICIDDILEFEVDTQEAQDLKLLYELNIKSTVN